MTIPDTQYAKSGDVSIAYQVGCEGPFELSGTVRDLVAGSGITFDTRGTRNLKGPGEWPLFAVAAA